MLYYKANYKETSVILLDLLLESAMLYYKANYKEDGVILHTALLLILLAIAMSYYMFPYMIVFITPSTIFQVMLYNPSNIESIFHETKITPGHHIIRHIT